MTKENIALLKEIKEVMSIALQLHSSEGNRIADKLSMIIVDYIEKNTETYEESKAIWDELLQEVDREN